jgi:hypothetical protein
MPENIVIKSAKQFWLSLCDEGTIPQKYALRHTSGLTSLLLPQYRTDAPESCPPFHWKHCTDTVSVILFSKARKQQAASRVNYAQPSLLYFNKFYVIRILG